MQSQFGREFNFTRNMGNQVYYSKAGSHVYYCFSMSDDEEEFVDWVDNDADDVQEGSENVSSRENEIEKGGKESAQRLRIAYTKSDRQWAEELHKKELLQLVRSAVQVNEWIQDELIHVSIMSILPAFLITSSRPTDEEKVRDVIAWFRMYFQTLSDRSVTSEEGRDGCSGEELMNVIISKTGSSHQLTQLFVATLRVLNFPTRYVCTLDPPGLHPRNHPSIIRKKICAFKEANGGVADGHANSIRIDIRSQERLERAPMAWAEVYISMPEKVTSSKRVTAVEGGGDKERQGRIDVRTRLLGKRKITTKDKNIMLAEVIDVDTPHDNIVVDTSSSSSSSSSSCLVASRMYRRWVHVDFLKGLIDDPTSIEAKRRGVAYILGVDQECILTDVTPRYNSQYSSILFDRLPRDSTFWRNIIRNWGAVRDFCLDSVEAIESLPCDNNDDFKRSSDELDEEAELQMKISAECVPTTLNQLKNHPLYILERDLKKEEVLHPTNKCVVGLVRGEKVYLREHVSVLRTKAQWKREMRVVKDEEIAFRSMQRKKEDASVTLELFGVWQTIPFEVLT